MPQRQTEFTEAKIIEVRQDLTELLRTHAVVARRLQRFGWPDDGTFGDLAEYLDKTLAELERRRNAKDGEVVEQLYALAQRYGYSYNGLTDIGQLLEQLEYAMKLWETFRTTMNQLGRNDIVAQIEDAS